jgi:hypothetical protein
MFACLDRSAMLDVPAPKKGSHSILYSFWAHDRKGLTIRSTLPAELPPLRLLLI